MKIYSESELNRAIATLEYNICNMPPECSIALQTLMRYAEDAVRLSKENIDKKCKLRAIKMYLEDI